MIMSRPVSVFARMLDSPSTSITTVSTSSGYGYAALVAIVATVHQDKITHFMGYLKKITHTSRNYGASAWASYDAA